MYIIHKVLLRIQEEVADNKFNLSHKVQYAPKNRKTRLMIKMSSRSISWGKSTWWDLQARQCEI